MATTRKRTTKSEEVKAEEVKQEMPVEDGDIITVEPEAVKEESVTMTNNVVVCSNYPLDLKFRIGEKSVIIKGNSSNLRGKAKGVLPTGGAFGITSVPTEAWEYIAKTYADAPYIKNGLVFASTAANARAEAKERAGLRHGFEPIDTTKTTTKEA